MAAIGFIGASGLMGHGMARNLLAKGSRQSEPVDVSTGDATNLSFTFP